VATSRSEYRDAGRDLFNAVWRFYLTWSLAQVAGLFVKEDHPCEKETCSGSHAEADNDPHREHYTFSSRCRLHRPGLSPTIGARFSSQSP
jgi:hypothetical protein